MPLRLPPAGRAAVLTYEPYYGLKEKPFSLSVDPRFLYRSRSHAPVFDDLLAGIRRREGLIVLTGDIGTGKTTICRAVLDALDRKTFSTFVPDPFVSREDLLKMLLVDFGVMSIDDLKSGRLNGAARPDLSYPLYEFLKSLVPLQAFAVLVIDEAQNLSVPLLEEIRILSDLEAPEKLLQVVLVGQLEFQAKLKLPEMRQVDQRVSVRCRLEPLNREAVAGYITHRLMVAGGASDRIAFAPEAIDLIFEISKGVPRLINLICDRGLHRGHLARTPLIDADIVRVAAADLGLADARVPKPPEFPASQPAVAARPLSEADQISADAAHKATAFDEHDLLHADHALSLPPRSSEIPFVPEQKPAEDVQVTPSATADRPLSLLVEGRQAFNREGIFPRLRWRRRTRRLAMMVGVLILVAAGFLGVSYVLSAEAELNGPIAVPSPPAAPVPIALQSTPQAALGAVPLIGDRPAAPEGAVAAVANGTSLYAIDVALFSSVPRAEQLVLALTAAGYRAYQHDVDLGARGHMREVLVGIYASRDAAEADAGKIRAMPGYQDAQVVAGPAPPAAASLR